MPVNPEFARQADEVYAKGGFVPRPKGARFRHLYDLFPEFVNQQGEDHPGWNSHPNNIVSVVLLGRFQGYDHYGQVIWYRGFKVTLSTGMILATYSRDSDQYVMCLHTGYSPQQV